MIHADLCVLTGFTGIGKTTLLINLISHLKSNNVPIQGIVTPNLMINGVLKGKLIRDISSGVEKPFASLNPEIPDGRHNLRFSFNRNAINWANTLFDEVSSCSNIFVDEIGPLELKMNSGLTSALKVIQERRFRKGLVVLRPNLVNLIKESWYVNEIFELANSASSGHILSELLSWMQSP